MEGTFFDDEWLKSINDTENDFDFSFFSQYYESEDMKSQITSFLTKDFFNMHFEYEDEFISDALCFCSCNHYHEIIDIFLSCPLYDGDHISHYEIFDCCQAVMDRKPRILIAKDSTDGYLASLKLLLQRGTKYSEFMAKIDRLFMIAISFCPPSVVVHVCALLIEYGANPFGDYLNNGVSDPYDSQIYYSRKFYEYTPPTQHMHINSKCDHDIYKAQNAVDYANTYGCYEVKKFFLGYILGYNRGVKIASSTCDTSSGEPDSTKFTITIKDDNITVTNRNGKYKIKRSRNQ